MGTIATGLGLHRSLTTLALVVLTSAPAAALVNLSPITSGTGTIGGTYTSTPIFTQPLNVRTVARQLCDRLPVPPTCPAADGTSTATIAWYDKSTTDVQTLVERQLDPNGLWSVRRTITGPVTGDRSIVDTGLAPDRRYCYRVTVKDAAGASRTSSSTCVVTQKAGDVPVTRAQLRVVLANVSGAGTDGWVSVALTEPPGNLPTGNFTGINTARDDFEVGPNDTYELNVGGVSSFRDITRISIASGSTDAFCVQRLQLIVNNNENNGITPNSGTVVYDKFYGTAANTCRWAGSTYGPLVVSHSELRSQTPFVTYAGAQPPSSIGPDEMESRLESIIGTLFWNRNDVAWDSDQTHAVTVTGVDDDIETVHVHLDFESLNEGPNPEVDIDFDVSLSFEPTASPNVWTLVFDTHNLRADVDFAWWTEVLSSLVYPVCNFPVAAATGTDPFLDCISHLEQYIEEKIESSFNGRSDRMPVTLPPGCTKPFVNVAGDDSIRFTCDGSASLTSGTAMTFTLGGTLSR